MNSIKKTVTHKSGTAVIKYKRGFRPLNAGYTPMLHRQRKWMDNGSAPGVLIPPPAPKGKSGESG